MLITLALGIGASTAIFSVINGVLLRPLPYRDGDRLVHVTQPATLAEVKNVGLSPKEVARRSGPRAATLGDVVEYHCMAFTIIGGEEPERVQTGVVSAEFFQALGVRPLLGRVFEPGEDAPGANPVLVLSYKYWQQKLGGDPEGDRPVLHHERPGRIRWSACSPPFRSTRRRTTSTCRSTPAPTGARRRWEGRAQPAG